VNDTPLLIIFARALHAGQVKTRLIPAFGAEGALQIYRQPVADACCRRGVSW